MEWMTEFPLTPTEMGTHLQPSWGFGYRQPQCHWRRFTWELTFPDETLPLPSRAKEALHKEPSLNARTEQHHMETLQELSLR